MEEWKSETLHRCIRRHRRHHAWPSYSPVLLLLLININCGPRRRRRQRRPFMAQQKRKNYVQNRFVVVSSSGPFHPTKIFKCLPHLILCSTFKYQINVFSFPLLLRLRLSISFYFHTFSRMPEKFIRFRYNISCPHGKKVVNTNGEKKEKPVASRVVSRCCRFCYSFIVPSASI